MYQDEMMKYKKRTSTDKRFDRVPESPKGYILPTYDLPGRDLADERASFAGMAFKCGLSLKGAEDAWDAHCRDIQKNHDLITEDEDSRVAREYPGDEKMTKFDATAELARIMRDKSNPYHHPTAMDHRYAVALAMRLEEIRAGQKDSLAGYLEDVDRADRERRKELYGPRSSKSGGETGSEKIQLPVVPQERPGNVIMPGEGGEDDSIGYGEKETKSGSGGRIEDALEGAEE